MMAEFSPHAWQTRVCGSQRECRPRLTDIQMELSSEF